MRLILAEDDPLIGEGIQLALQQEGYNVDWIKNGRQALQAILSEDYSMAILDLGLPDMDGLQVLEKTRSAKLSVPILILTARDAIQDRVSGLDMGADDYLVKPFDIDELSARVRSLMRRSQGRSQPMITAGELSLDPASHTLTYHNETIELSQKELSILRYLMEHKNQIASRHQLEEQIYGWNQEIESNAIEVHIHNLRKKLDKSLIKTVRGLGYRLNTKQTNNTDT